MRPDPAARPCPVRGAAHGTNAILLGLACALTLAPPLPVLAQTPALRIEPLGTIGCGTCDDARAFSVIYSLALRSGRILVADRDPPHLRLFGLDGSLVAAWGSTGDGPGEIRFPMEVGIRPGGGAYVVDPRRSRITILADDGREVGAAPTGFPLAAAFAPDGSIAWLARADFRAGTAELERWREGDDAPSPLPEGRGLLRPPEPDGHMVNPGLAVDPRGGAAVTLGGEVYRILLFDAEGRSAGEIVRDVPRRPRTAEELETLRERLRRGPPGGGPEGTARPTEPDPLMPHFNLDALAWDEDGRLWIRTNRGVDDTVFDVFRDARFVGEVVVPGRVQAFAVGDGILATSILDDLDLPTIHLWRVREGPGGQPLPPPGAGG